nr:hypothetical protein [Moorena sp. SIO3F7]
MVVIGVIYLETYLPIPQCFGTTNSGDRLWRVLKGRSQGVIEEIRDILHRRVREQVKKKGNGQP